jgi:hypothetical protein
LFRWCAGNKLLVIGTVLTVLLYFAPARSVDSVDAIEWWLTPQHLLDIGSASGCLHLVSYQSLHPDPAAVSPLPYLEHPVTRAYNHGTQIWRAPGIGYYHVLSSVSGWTMRIVLIDYWLAMLVVATPTLWGWTRRLSPRSGHGFSMEQSEERSRPSVPGFDEAESMNEAVRAHGCQASEVARVISTPDRRGIRRDQLTHLTATAGLIVGTALSCVVYLAMARSAKFWDIIEVQLPTYQMLQMHSTQCMFSLVLLWEPQPIRTKRNPQWIRMLASGGGSVGNTVFALPGLRYSYRASSPRSDEMRYELTVSYWYAALVIGVSTALGWWRRIGRRMQCDAEPRGGDLGPVSKQ